MRDRVLRSFYLPLSMDAKLTLMMKETGCGRNDLIRVAIMQKLDDWCADETKVTIDIKSADNWADHLRQQANHAERLQNYDKAERLRREATHFDENGSESEPSAEQRSLPHIGEVFAAFQKFQNDSRRHVINPAKFKEAVDEFKSKCDGWKFEIDWSEDASNAG